MDNNSILLLSTSNNLSDISSMMRYLKQHSSEEVYNRVYKDFTKLIKLTFIFLSILSVFTFIAIGVGLNMLDNERTKYDNCGKAYAFVNTDKKTLRVTYKDAAFDLSPSEAGIDIDNYKNHHRFYIYYDEDENIVGIEDANNDFNPAIILAASPLPIDIILTIVLVIWMRKSKKSPALEYIIFGKWYHTTKNLANMEYLGNGQGRLMQIDES